MTHSGGAGGEKGGRKRGEGLPKSRILHGATAVSLCSPPLPTVCITRCSAVWWQGSPLGCSAGSPWPPEVRAPGSGQSGGVAFLWPPHFLCPASRQLRPDGNTPVLLQVGIQRRSTGSKSGLSPGAFHAKIHRYERKLLGKHSEWK